MQEGAGGWEGEEGSESPPAPASRAVPPPVGDRTPFVVAGDGAPGDHSRPVSVRLATAAWVVAGVAALAAVGAGAVDAPQRQQALERALSVGDRARAGAAATAAVDVALGWLLLVAAVALALAVPAGRRRWAAGVLVAVGVLDLAAVVVLPSLLGRGWRSPTPELWLIVVHAAAVAVGLLAQQSRAGRDARRRRRPR